MGDYREETIADLVAECLVHHENGVDAIPFERICAEHPELRDEVERSVARAAEFPGMQAAGPGGDALLGSLVAGRYRVRGRLGSGAMGVVYAATDLDLGREVAIKVVMTGFQRRSQALARFDREAAALAAVQHESVVTIHDRGVTDDDAPFLVMEQLDGVSCAAILDQARHEENPDSTDWLLERYGIEALPEPSFLRQAVRWAADLASGLEAAHRAGVYHRDVKPSNVMIRRDGRAVLLDFGIAAKDDEATLTQTGAAVGTPIYMAPEALSGNAKARPTQDVYGLAAMLYHLLTLQAPYSGSPTEVLTALATREPVAASRVRPGLPRDAQAILDHGLARNVGSRYASAKAIESDLRALLAFRPVSVRPTSTLVHMVRRVRRSRLLLGAVAASLVIGGGLVFQQWSKHRAAVRIERFEDAWEHVPANLGVVSAANRRYASQEAHDAILATLNDVVASGHQLVAGLTLRATFHADYGDRGSAAADMERVAGIRKTPYAVELAKRYRASADRGEAFDLSELPDPEDPLDRYLAAVHLMRVGAYGAGLTLLEAVPTAPLRHAQELRFFREILQTNPLPVGEQRFAIAERMRSGLRELEAASGWKSAMTAHLRSYAQRRLNRERRSLDAAIEGLELCAYSVATLQNAAESAFQLAEVDEARDYVQRALGLVPSYAVLRGLWARIEALGGDYRLARQILNETVFTPTRNDPAPRANLLADVAVMELLRVRWDDSDRAAECAELALQYASQLSDKSDTKRRVQIVAAAEIAGGDSSFFAAMMRMLALSPESTLFHADALRAMPAELDAEATAAVRSMLEAQRQLQTLRRDLTDTEQGDDSEVAEPPSHANSDRR